MNPFFHFKHFGTLSHAITTKASGNIAYHVGDDKNRVDTNHHTLAQTLGYPEKNLVFMQQIHSDKIEIITQKPDTILSCDALLSNQKGIALMVIVADCIPILLFDPIKNVIGVIHAGREGLIKEIIPKTLKKMCEHFESNINDILVGIGPSISGVCYEIGSKMAELLMPKFSNVLSYSEEKCTFDGTKLAFLQLENSGILKANIEHINICNHCKTDTFYSYRAEGNTGRFSGVIWLN
jgi:YfiH family protein